MRGRKRTPRPTLWKARVGHPDSTSHLSSGPPAIRPSRHWRRGVGKERQPQDPGSQSEPGAPSVVVRLEETGTRGGSVYSESFKKRSWESATPRHPAKLGKSSVISHKFSVFGEEKRRETQDPPSNYEGGAPGVAQRRSRGSYIVMGSLAWRVTYQHGRIPAWEKRERTQGRSSSGFWDSIS